MTKAAISADSPLTAAAGARIAEQGGNAVDIAVAAALAATVSEVLMCSLGGAGFFMVRMPGKSAELIEGADAFPSQMKMLESGSPAWRTIHLPYGDGVDTQAGHASISVPGVLAAAEKTWQLHGSLPWPEIVAPALELASGPIPASKTLASWLSLAGRLLLFQQTTSRASFFSGDEPLVVGERFQIPGLKDSLEAISRQGAAALYRGDLSARFADTICEGGGFVSREDLENYQATVRKPLTIESGGFQLALNPPPAAGGAAVGFLIRNCEATWRKDLTPAQQVRALAEAQQKLIGIRETELADPGWDTVSAKKLLSLVSATGPTTLQAPGTTQLSVATSDGAMVAITMSMGYGSGIVIPELGIACNNSLGESELNPRGFHAGEPGSRLTTNMSPMVAWHPDGRCLALGSPGASRITTAIAQTWLHVVLDGKSYEDSVAAPRLHIEPFGEHLRAQFEPGIDISLLGDQFVLRSFDSTDWYFGGVKLAGIDERGKLHAVADSRREGGVEFV